MTSNNLYLLNTNEGTITAVWPYSGNSVITLSLNGVVQSRKECTRTTQCGDILCFLCEFSGLVEGNTYDISVIIDNNTVVSSILLPNSAVRCCTPVLHSMVPLETCSDRYTSLYCIWSSLESCSHFRVDYSTSEYFTPCDTVYAMQNCYTYLENLKQNTLYYIRVSAQATTPELQSSYYSNTITYTTKNIAEVTDSSATINSKYGYKLTLKSAPGLGNIVSSQVSPLKSDYLVASYTDKSCTACQDYRYKLRFPLSSNAVYTDGTTYCLGIVLDINLDTDYSLFTIRQDGIPISTTKLAPLDSDDIINKLFTGSLDDTSVYFDLEDNINPFVTITIKNAS